VLENSSRQGNELGYSLAELAYIYHQFSEEHQARLGICLDLCHVFVAGELDLRWAADVRKFFEDFEDSLGLEKLCCIHFNDSRVPFGGRNDHHGDLGCGYISNPLLGGSTEGLEVAAEVAAAHQ